MKFSPVFLSYATAVTLHVGVLAGVTWYMSSQSEQANSPERPSVTVSFQGPTGGVVAMPADDSTVSSPVELSESLFSDTKLFRESTSDATRIEPVAKPEVSVDFESVSETADVPVQKVAKALSRPNILPKPEVDQKESPLQPSELKIPMPVQQVVMAPVILAMDEATDIIGATIQSIGMNQNQTESILTPAGFIHLPDPVYPRVSRRRAQEGTVRLSVTILETGKASAISILESSGHQRLDESALKALEKARFYPAKKGSTPISTTKKVSIRFDLDE